MNYYINSNNNYAIKERLVNEGKSRIFNDWNDHVQIIQDCEMKKVVDSNNNAITNKNVAISKINDEMFIMGQILEVVNIDNFLVTVVDNKDNSYMLDFEDNHFLFMFNVSDNEIQIMKNEILKKMEE